MLKMMNPIKSHLVAFGVLLQFLTRFPLPLTIPCDEDTFKKGLYWFAPVGLLLGLALVLAYRLLLLLGLEPFAMAILITWAHVWFTGGLHLDGVADSADGLFSNRSPERILEIMKDSRIGSNGVLGLLGVLSLKALGIYLALLQPHPEYVLLIVPALGRAAAVLLAFIGTSPRSQGMGNLFIGQGRGTTVFINALWISGLSPWVPYILMPLVTVALTTAGIKRFCTRRIGGITGDILGLTIEVSEVIGLFVAYLAFRLGIH